MTKFKRLVAQFKYWLADRSELVARAEYAERQLVRCDHIMTARNDAMRSSSERSERLAGENAELREQLKVAESNANVFQEQRDEARAKLVRMSARGAGGKFVGKGS